MKKMIRSGLLCFLGVTALSSYAMVDRDSDEEDTYEEVESPSNDFMKALQTRYANADEIIHRYNQGRKLFCSIVENKQREQLSQESVRDILWFFYIYAVIHKENNQFFDEGTFSLRGDLGQISRFFDALKEAGAYQRMSSHYPEWFPELTFENLFAHYGIDLEDAPPRDMGTVLFAKHPTVGMMYLKPEAHGTASLNDLSAHTISYLKSQATKKLPQQVNDILRYWISLPEDQGEKLRKERVPSEIVVQAVDLTRQAEKALGTPKKQIDDLCKLIKEEGIRIIYPKMADYLFGDELKKQDEKLFKEIDEFYTTTLKEYESKDWQYRKGNEITLTVDELVKAPRLIDPEELKRARSGVLDTLESLEKESKEKEPEA